MKIFINVALYSSSIYLTNHVIYIDIGNILQIMNILFFDRSFFLFFSSFRVYVMWLCNEVTFPIARLMRVTQLEHLRAWGGGRKIWGSPR